MRHIYRFACIAAALLVLVTPGCATAPPPVQESDVTMVVDGFYQAIRKADGPAAMQFIAPDAEFIETGKLETRSEYEDPGRDGVGENHDRIRGHVRGLAGKLRQRAARRTDAQRRRLAHPVDRLVVDAAVALR
jgi:hypothetical protein